MPVLYYGRLLTRPFISTSMIISCRQCEFEVVSRFQDSTMTSKFNHFSFEFFTSSACPQLSVKTSPVPSRRSPSGASCSTTPCDIVPIVARAPLKRNDSCLALFLSRRHPHSSCHHQRDRQVFYPTNARGVFTADDPSATGRAE